MIHLLAFLALALGLVLLVGHMTCAVLASGKRHAEERYEVWANELWRQQAEARWTEEMEERSRRLYAVANRDEQRRYAETVTALVAEDAVREWELMLQEAR